MKPLKRHEWMRQPLPHLKDETKEQRKERREIYLYQRSLPAPIPYVVLHGSHTKLSSASTVGFQVVLTKSQPRDESPA